MDNSLLIQYVLIAVVVIGAGYALFRMIAKNFRPGKFKKGKPGCDSDCGC